MIPEIYVLVYLFCPKFQVANLIIKFAFVNSWIRLVGIINAMTTKATWRMRGLPEEMHRLVAVIQDDIETIREQRRQDRKGK